MTKWRVRSYKWEENEQVVEEETIEADDVCTVDGVLVFSENTPSDPVFGQTVKIRSAGEWFAVDRVEE